MIKFFRKIRYNLLETGKTTEYFKYAIGEIILVVIGILIALQINNWNENRKERIKEKEYLTRLKEDLISDRNAIELNQDFYQDVFVAGSLVLSHAEGEDDISTSQWDILTSYFHASQIWPMLMQSSTYEELKSSGELSFIQNVTLRNRLPFYHGNGLKRYQQTMGINPPYRKMIRGLIPSKIQNYMWDNCHVTEGDNQILQKCDPFISEEEARVLIFDLSSNSKLIEELRFYMSNIKVGQATLMEQGRLCDAIINEIEKELAY
ncbi:hypothetical protein FBALC1_13067 [Flavobacteriales bacterium ALC-1]|nr:hypothetical protein FBALC1_13067 [Flavobacteriales bacterium ALC-1]